LSIVNNGDENVLTQGQLVNFNDKTVGRLKMLHQQEKKDGCKNPLHIGTRG
jgi:hypothetical protein